MSPFSTFLCIRSRLRSCSGAPCPGYNTCSENRCYSMQLPNTAEGSRFDNIGHFLLVRPLNVAIGESGSQHIPRRVLRVPQNNFACILCYHFTRKKCIIEIKRSMCDQLVNDPDPHFNVQAFGVAVRGRQFPSAPTFIDRIEPPNLALISASEVG